MGDCAGKAKEEEEPHRDRTDDSIDEGKQPQTLDPDPDADGLTYVELDGRTLQAKRGGLAPAPEPVQPSIYAAINMSRGAPQLEPRCDGQRKRRDIVDFLELEPSAEFLIWGSVLSGVGLRGVGGSTEGPPAAPIMASALMSLFLGCWLAGRSGVSGQLPAPGPSISVSPSEVIAPGRGVTIRCQCQCEGRRLFLYKGGIEIRALDAAGDGGEFTIPSVRQEDSGSYSCRSRSRSEPPDWSYPSNIVWIIVAELSYQKPSISLHPSGGVALGGAVTVRCRGPYQNARFLLYRDGNPTALQDTGPAGDLAEFPIRNMSRKDAGNYSCYYRSKLNPFTWSHPSDPVELLVAEPSYPKPSISLHPSGWVTPGGAVTIRCECRCRGARVLLSKAGDPDARRSMDPTGDVAEFPIRNVSQRDAGSYSCRYHTKSNLSVWSEPSDPVELVIAVQRPLVVQIPQTLLALTPLDALGPPDVLPIEFSAACALRCPSPLGTGCGGTDQLPPALTAAAVSKVNQNHRHLRV
ncbi:alpha-1B-glycoprotein-like [Pangshura tecta]